jgi:murein L,D-transpeptidase YcbB/YkuD
MRAMSLRFLAAVAALFFSSLVHAADDPPVWFDGSKLNARAHALLSVLRAAGEHGLEPAWYGVAEIEKAEQVRAEKLLTDALVAYAGDVSTGRVRANRLDKDIDIDQRKPVERSELLKTAAATADFAAWLAALPPRGDYPALQRALATWRDRRGIGEYTPFPAGPALKPGMTDLRVPALRKRLGELGYPVAEPLPPTSQYDDELVAAVKQYQQTLGLTVDGVIGDNTRRSFNVTIEERIEQIVANLERRRWLSADLGSRHVLVNAADYSMVFVDDGRKVFESVVIVGTPKDPTPEISSTMRGFQINPYWTVPQSIAGEEYLPLLRKNPRALAGTTFRLFTGWSDDIELDPTTVDWNAIHPKAFPYRIRQEPGAANALGYIFFPFNNKYGTYMHDTASRFLFSEGSRNFSHGCIRLKNPLEFVELVFKGRNGFSKDRVKAAIEAGQQHHYAFPEPVVLHVTYRTVSVGADGAPVFRDDVYGRDRRVAKAMRGGST